MMKPSPQNDIAFAPSVYYAESTVHCDLAHAWNVMIDYRAWNPTFVDAEVILISGQPSTEGELVLIKKSLTDVKGQPLPEFYAATVKVAPRQHIAWYVYPTGQDVFRNFVDFALTPMSSGVKFNIYYYAQNRLSGELLTNERTNTQTMLHNIAIAFKEYCEMDSRHAQR